MMTIPPNICRQFWIVEQLLQEWSFWEKNSNHRNVSIIIFGVFLWKPIKWNQKHKYIAWSSNNFLMEEIGNNWKNKLHEISVEWIKQIGKNPRRP